MKLRYWKFQLRRRYLHYANLLDEFSCGAALAEHLSGRVVEAKNAVNEAIRKCKELDPGCSTMAEI
jgi:hypothetical protein